MNNILTTDNIFRDKLKFWYGKHLSNKKVMILHTDNVEGELCTVIFIVKEDTKIEIIRVFTIGDRVELSVDLQCDIKCFGAIKQLIQYGGNFDKFEIEDEYEFI